MIPRLAIAGTNSGVGKTTFTVGLCGALRRLGLRVTLFKCGPDYLDPTWHLGASGKPSQTLDGWMMGRAGVLSTFHNATRDADIALIEGVMGLFDGADAISDSGSTAEVAKWLEAPVLLVIDASGMSRSIAALANGFASFDAELRVAGVLANRVGSRGHLDLLKQASTLIPVVGGLPRDRVMAFPERHLGLHAAHVTSTSANLLDAWAEHVGAWCDLERIVKMARSATALPVNPVVAKPRQPPCCRIGIARDEAFHFYYDENLRLLERFGAELIAFSPIHDSQLPAVEALYFGGGYPELHAAALAQNVTLRNQVKTFCESGQPVYAECGGLMYLCSAIRLCDGSSHPMAGLFAADAVMNDRLQALGYVEATTHRDSILGAAGQSFRGHQFRYSTLQWRAESNSAYTLTVRRGCHEGEEGFMRNNVLASYVHAHWASNPAIPEALVKAASSSRRALSLPAHR